MDRDHNQERPSSQPKRRREVRERSKLACDQCRSGKLKCDNQHPCQSCRNKRIECTVSKSSRPPGRPRSRKTGRRPLEDTLPSSTDIRGLPNVLSTSEIPGIDLHQETITHDRVRPSVTTDASRLPTRQADREPQSTDVARRFHVLEGPGSQSRLQAISTAIGLDASFPYQGAMFFDSIESISADFVDVDFNDPLWQLSPGMSDWLDALSPIDTGSHSQQMAQTAINSTDASTTDNAVSLVLDYYSRRSKASSPASEIPKRSWCFAQPGLHKYDKEVINVLLNVGRAHVSTTFTIFFDFEVTNATSQQLCLAMAAIGALYSTTEGSATVAKSLFNDARSLQLEKFVKEETPGFMSSVDSAKTFLLLDLYGICSGDKRAYELCEVYRYNTIEAFRLCWRTAPLDANELTRKALAHLAQSLRILDSYWVLLMSRPPLFLSLNDPTIEMTQAVLDDQHMSTTGLETIMTPVAPISASFATSQNLATLSAFVWMSSPRGHEISRRLQAWRAEFVELGLDRWKWAKSQMTQDADLSQLLIYHLAYINLYSNLPLLQRFAHIFVDPSKRPAEDPMFDGIQVWVNGYYCTIAQWHAEAMIRQIKGSLTAPYQRRQPTSHRPRFLEPPHLSYCIYFATLVIWYGGKGLKSSTISRNAPIEVATQLLGRLQAPVAKVMDAALCELLVEDHMQ